MSPAAWLVLWLVAQTAPVPATHTAVLGVTAEALEQSFLAEQRALLASEKERGRVVKNIESLAAQKRAVRERMHALTEQQLALQGRLEAIQLRQAELRVRMLARQKVAGDRLALLARRSSARPLELLLTAASPGDFVYRYHALRAIAAAEKNMLAEARAAAGELDASQLILAHELAQSQTLARELDLEFLRVKALETLQLEQFALLEDEVEERRVWIDAIREEAKALGHLINQLQSAQKKEAKPMAGGPIDGVRVAAFGDSDPRTGNLLPSDGWSFHAEEGTPVRAVAGGTIVFADWFQGYGFLVIVDHGGSVSTLYAHLAGVAVEKGSAVSAGEIVGSAGSSGSVTTPGIYFEVRKNGLPVDPASWLRDR